MPPPAGYRAFFNVLTREGAANKNVRRTEGREEAESLIDSVTASFREALMQAWKANDTSAFLSHFKSSVDVLYDEPYVFTAAEAFRQGIVAEVGRIKGVDSEVYLHRILFFFEASIHAVNYLNNEELFVNDFEAKFEPPRGAAEFHDVLWGAVRETIHSEGEETARRQISDACKVFTEACVLAGPEKQVFQDYFEAKADPNFTSLFAEGDVCMTNANLLYEGIGVAATVILDPHGHEEAIVFVSRACEVFSVACSATRSTDEFLAEYNLHF